MSDATVTPQTVSATSCVQPDPSEIPNVGPDLPPALADNNPFDPSLLMASVGAPVDDTAEMLSEDGAE